jgi:hypothetical protein
MRIVGVDLGGEPFAGAQGLDLARITTMWGANDAGKSTTLRATARSFGRSLHESRPCLGIRVQMDPDLGGELAARAFEQLAIDGSYAFVLGDRQVLLSCVEADAGLLTAARDAAEERDALEEWLALCLDAAGLTLEHARGQVARSLADALLLVLVPAGQYLDGTPGWELWWGLTDGKEADDVDALLSEFGVDQVNRHMGTRILVPAALEPLGSTVLPIPVGAPLQWAELEQRLEGASRALADVADAWLAATWETRLVDVRTAAERVLTAIITSVGQHLPPFIASRYALAASVDDDGHSRLQVSRRADGMTFPIAVLAEGFHLWVQVAVLASTDAAERCAREAPDLDQELTPTLHARADDALRLLMESDWTPEKGKLLGDLLERYAVQAGVPSGSVGSDPLNDLIRLGSRLFLIDEPEAHLHPTAQREAVSWLEDQVRLG